MRSASLFAALVVTARSPVTTEGSSMSDATLTVPAKYADDFRAALVHELVEEARLAKKGRREYLEAVVEERYGGKKADDADWRGYLKLLDRDAELYRQAGYEGTGDIEISVEDDLGVVAFACETVARKVVASQITDALEAGPFDAKQAARLRELMERLAWASTRPSR